MERIKETLIDTEKISTAYDLPSWWYDVRGFFILKLAYQSSLWSQIRFFARNISETHVEIAIGSGSLFQLMLWYRKWQGQPIGKVVGIDYAESMLAGARKRFRSHPDIRLCQGNVIQLDCQDGAYGSANIANALHCFSNVDAALKEVQRALGHGGSLAVNILLYPRGWRPLRNIAETINRWGIRKGILVTPYDADDIRKRIVSAGFEIREEIIHGNSYSLRAVKISHKLREG